MTAKRSASGSRNDGLKKRVEELNDAGVGLVGFAEPSIRGKMPLLRIDGCFVFDKRVGFPPVLTILPVNALGGSLRAWAVRACP